MDDWDSFIKGAPQPAAPPIQNAPSDGWDSFIKGTPKQNGPRIIPVNPQEQNTPMARKFAKEVQDKQDKELLAKYNVGPGVAAMSSWANTVGMNLPRLANSYIQSGISGNPQEQEYQRLSNIDAALARQYQKPSIAGTVGGALTAAAVLPVARAATAGARALMGAGTGATIGGISEFADSRDPEKAVQSAAISGLVSGIASPVAERVISAPVNAVGKAFQAKPQIPTTPELKSASQSAYALADQAGLIVKPQGVQTLASDVKTMLANEGYHPALQGKVAPALQELDNLSQGNVTLKGLDVLRKMTSAARMDSDPSTRRLGAMMVEKIDEYLGNLTPNDVLMGNAQQGVAALKEARSLWSSFRKSDMVDEALKMAELRSQSTYSGGNIENAIRQEFRKILQNPKKSAAFSDQEKAALARVVSGNKGQGTVRLLGKLAPQGAITVAMNLGAAGATGGMSAVGTAAAQGAKKLSEGMTKANVDTLSKTIRARGGKISKDNVLEAQAADRLRNFFSSIGVNLDQLRQSEEQ